MPAPKYKVGLVIDTSLDLEDGVQQYVLSIGDWLTSQGHEVHYLAGETKNRKLPHLHSLSRNVSLRFNGNRVNIPLWAPRKKVAKLMADEQFDVLHVQTPHHPLMAQRIMVEAPANTAVLTTFHILPYGRFAATANKFLGRLLAPSLKRVDQMLAVSPAAADFEAVTFGLPAVISPNVFDYPRFHDAQPLTQYDDEVLTILFLGRLVERKGCQYLIEAIARLDRDELPAFRVLICGKGALLPDLQALVRQRKLESVVTFVGFVSDIEKPQYFASADVAVFPSTAGESFGIVLLEAMASGRAAVLAGDNPGYASVMSPRDELLFEPRDIAGLANTLAEYLRSTKQRREAAAWAAKHAQRFDVGIVGPQLVAEYERAVAKRRRARNNTA